MIPSTRGGTNGPITETETQTDIAMTSLTMLISWTVWNERNARVFRLKFASPPVLLGSILGEAKLWVTAGAKKLGTVIFWE